MILLQEKNLVTCFVGILLLITNTITIVASVDSYLSEYWCSHIYLCSDNKIK